MVFVHGSLCDYRYWDPQLASLSAHYRCIAPSLSHYWPAVEAGIQDEFSWQNHVDEPPNSSTRSISAPCTWSATRAAAASRSTSRASIRISSTR